MIVDGDKPKRGAARARPRVPGAPYTIDQAADVLNLSPRTVRNRILAGRIVAYKDGSMWRITERAVADYLANLVGNAGMSS